MEPLPDDWLLLLLLLLLCGKRVSEASADVIEVRELLLVVIAEDVESALLPLSADRPP